MFVTYVEFLYIRQLWGEGRYYQFYQKLSSYSPKPYELHVIIIKLPFSQSVGNLVLFFFFFHHPSWAHSWVCDHYHLDYSYTGN